MPNKSSHAGAPRLGDGRPTIPYEVAKRFERELPQAKLVAVEGCGHLVLWDCGDRAIPEVLAFLREGRPSTTAANNGMQRTRKICVPLIINGSRAPLKAGVRPSCPQRTLVSVTF